MALRRGCPTMNSEADSGMSTILNRKAARARCDATTAGPWEYQGRSVVAPVNESPYDQVLSGAHWKPNAEFAAHARTDLPASLDLLDRCEAALRKARGYAQLAAGPWARGGADALRSVEEIGDLLRDLGGEP
jgi:hypothetical protein